MKTDLFDDEEEWAPPSSLPDLTNCERMAIDLETRDPNLTTLGPGWCRTTVTLSVLPWQQVILLVIFLSVTRPVEICQKKLSSTG